MNENEAGLRSAAWPASQATEKALKLLIRRRGQTPPPTTSFLELADRAESLGAEAIDRVKLALIPSGRDADCHEVCGDMTLSKAVDAYGAALSIIRQVVFEAKPTPNTMCARRGSKFDGRLGSTSTQARSVRNCAHRLTSK